MQTPPPSPKMTPPHIIRLHIAARLLMLLGAVLWATRPEDPPPPWIAYPLCACLALYLYVGIYFGIFPPDREESSDGEG